MWDVRLALKIGAANGLGIGSKCLRGERKLSPPADARAARGAQRPQRGRGGENELREQNAIVTEVTFPTYSPGSPEGFGGPPNVP